MAEKHTHEEAAKSAHPHAHAAPAHPHAPTAAEKRAAKKAAEPKPNVIVKHNVVGRFEQGNIVPVECFHHKDTDGGVLDDVPRLIELGAVEYTDDEPNVTADLSAIPIKPKPPAPA